MKQTTLCVVVCYLLVMNLVGVIATVADKKRARREQWRIPESTLLLISALGGSVGMYLTMKKIRHKTKHAKFMVGIPAIFLLQAMLFFVAARMLF